MDNLRSPKTPDPLAPRSGSASRTYFAPAALVCTFDSECANPYGCALLARAYPAWFEKWMPGGAKRTLRLRMVKDAYIGDIVCGIPPLRKPPSFAIRKNSQRVLRKRLPAISRKTYRRPTPLKYGHIRVYGYLTKTMRRGDISPTAVGVFISKGVFTVKMKHVVLTLCFLAVVLALAGDAEAGIFGRRRCRGCSTTLPRSTTVQAQIQLLQGQITDLQLRVQQLEAPQP